MSNVDSNSVLNDVTFQSNSANLGGGIYTTGSLSLWDVTLEGNTASADGGGLYNLGDSIFLKNIRLIRNSAIGHGGGMFSSGRASAFDVTFLENSSGGSGGGMYSSGGAYMENVTFSGNSAVRGGGLFGYNSPSSSRVISLRNTTFYGNSATEGGGLYSKNSDDSGRVPDVRNVTFSENSATLGNGIYNNHGFFSVMNSILYDRIGDEIHNETGITSVGYSIVRGGYEGIGNLDADPKLKPLANNGGFTETTSILPNSPAIDAGLDIYCMTTDQRGVKRPQGSHCDMGAYEYNMNIEVKLGNHILGRYEIFSGERITPQYPELNGPVNVASTDSLSVFASERVHNRTGFVNELMGIPNSQLANEYWFPWYDNMSMQSWILVGNPSTTTDAHVHIYIAGVEQQYSPYTIEPSKSITPLYPGVLNGPVHIVSDINVFSTQRVHTAQGFVNEMAGIPNDQLATEYWFPWYDNLSMTSWILVGNPSTDTDAHVHVYIAGVEQKDSPYTIKPGERITPQYPVLNGPVHVVSDINVITTQRVHNATGFINEAAGIPNDQLTTEYWFPWYDNLSMRSWILIGNPSTTTDAHVHIYIAGVEQKDSPYTIEPGQKITPQYPVLNGPVHIVSDINVLTSERVHTGQGFVNEAMGIPNDQLTTEYWFPWYDNLSMQSWILVGKP